MTTRDKKLELIINHATNQTVAQVHREYERSGQWWPDDPVALSLESDGFSDFVESFGVAQQAEISALTATIAEKQTEIDSLTTQLTTATAAIETITTERDAALTEVTRVTNDRDNWRRVAEALETEKAALIAQLTASQAHATDLESQLDRVVTGAGNRRLISPRAWQARFTQDEELDLSISSDAGIIQGLMAVKSLIQSNRLFSIDHAMTEATLNAMIRVGIINEARKSNLMRDSLASERVLS